MRDQVGAMNDHTHSQLSVQQWKEPWISDQGVWVQTPLGMNHFQRCLMSLLQLSCCKMGLVRDGTFFAKDSFASSIMMTSSK